MATFKNCEIFPTYYFSNVRGYRATLKGGSNREEKIRILFDTGAQSSFINEEISEELNLPIVRKERRFIQTFEDKNVETRILNVVQAKIKSVHNRKFVYIELFFVPQIKRLHANIW